MQRHMSWLQLLSAHAAVVLENSRLNMQLAAQNKSLEAKVAQRTQELALAMEQAQQASRAKTQFLSTISHEVCAVLSQGILWLTVPCFPIGLRQIRTPLNGILV